MIDGVTSLQGSGVIAALTGRVLRISAKMLIRDWWRHVRQVLTGRYHACNSRRSRYFCLRHHLISQMLCGAWTQLWSALQWICTMVRGCSFAAWNNCCCCCYSSVGSGRCIQLGVWMLGAAHLSIVMRQPLDTRVRRADIVCLADGAVLRHACLLF